MLKDADPSSFAAIYVVCGFTNMRYGIDSLAAMIESRFHLPLFVPGTLLTLVKAAGSEQAEGIIAAEASRRISRLFHLDKKWKDLSAPFSPVQWSYSDGQQSC